jgi:hypothetical protein
VEDAIEDADIRIGDDGDTVLAVQGIVADEEAFFSEAAEAIGPVQAGDEGGRSGCAYEEGAFVDTGRFAMDLF